MFIEGIYLKKAKLNVREIRGGLKMRIFLDMKLKGFTIVPVT